MKKLTTIILIITLFLSTCFGVNANFFVSGEPKPKTEIWEITATQLNFRQGPGVSYTSNGLLPNGTVINIYEKQYNGTTLWGRSDKGWCSLHYCKYISGSIADGSFYTVTVDEIGCNSATVKAQTFETVDFTEYGFCIGLSETEQTKFSVVANDKADTFTLKIQDYFELTAYTTYYYSFYFLNSENEQQTSETKTFTTEYDYGEQVKALGVDVSFWQEDIDWKLVKDDGIDFAIIRAGSTKGKDSYFEQNYDGANEVGINTGLYFYSYATTPEQAYFDATDLLKWIDGRKFEYPIYLDLEDPIMLSLTTEERMNITNTFCQTIRDGGYLPGVYANENWLKNYLDRDYLLKTYPVWYARWNKTTFKPDEDYSGEGYGLWQYTDSGKVDGIKWNADCNVAYCDYMPYILCNGLNGYEESHEFVSQHFESDGINHPYTKMTCVNCGKTKEIIEGEIVKGDVNYDGNVDMLDLMILGRYLAEWDKTEINKINADMSLDGKVTSVDLYVLSSFLTNGLVD